MRSASFDFIFLESQSKKVTNAMDQNGLNSPSMWVVATMTSEHGGKENQASAPVLVGRRYY